MPESILKLKKDAMKAGMPKAEAMAADRKVLETFLANPKSEKPAAKKASKKSTSEKTVAKKKAASKKDKAKTEKPKSTKKSADKKAPAEKSATKAGKAKRPSKGMATTDPKFDAKKTKKTAKPKARKKSDDDSGRNELGSIDWKIESDDWNPRKGSAVEKLFKALKKRRGNVDTAFEDLKADVWEFVGKEKRDGTKRDKPSAHTMLRYRLNRTAWEFAVRTGQHEASTNRVEYGTGDHAKATKKATKKVKAAPERKKPTEGKRKPKTAAKKSSKRSKK